MITGIAVECTVCKRNKAPHGRSAPDYANLCEGHLCHGYSKEPLPGCLWPGETSEQFGFAHCNNATEDR